MFAQDTTDARYAFILNYPATASWAAYPNTKKYFLQDGSSEATKTSFDKISQKEPFHSYLNLPESILDKFAPSAQERVVSLETAHVQR